MIELQQFTGTVPCGDYSLEFFFDGEALQLSVACSSPQDAFRVIEHLEGFAAPPAKRARKAKLEKAKKPEKAAKAAKPEKAAKAAKAEKAPREGKRAYTRTKPLRAQMKAIVELGQAEVARRLGREIEDFSGITKTEAETILAAVPQLTTAETPEEEAAEEGSGFDGEREFPEDAPAPDGGEIPESLMTAENFLAAVQAVREIGFTSVEATTTYLESVREQVPALAKVKAKDLGRRVESVWGAL